MPLSLILDITVAILLVITIGYAVVLNKRLGNLRRDKAELEKFALSFHAATERAEESITRLKDGVEALQEKVEKAESLRDDLVFLTERGGNAADRLEASIRAARDEVGVGPAPGREVAVAPAAPPPAVEGVREPVEPVKNELKAEPGDRVASDHVSEAERELLKALRSAG